MTSRKPREQEARETTERKRAWQRPQALPTPEPRAGYKFRWIRASMVGNSDNSNVSSRFREGYVPVKAADFPELHLIPDMDSRFKDNIEIGGLLLCAIPQEIADDRIDQQLESANRQIEAVDNNYMRQSDPRMPVLRPERESRTSFGRG